MYSFYGGRPGAAFVIVKTFPSINDMILAFGQGSNYIDVHYDEYVLINTEDRNDKDNGKLYRRGYDYSNNMGGAEYIGRLVGPAGPAPNLIPTAYQHTTDPFDSPTAYIYTSESGQSEEKKVPGFVYNGYGIDIDTYIAEHEGEEDLPQQVLDNFGIDAYVSHYANVDSQTTISTIGALTTNNKGLVSGKQSKQIIWKSVSFTTPNGTTSDAYITFQVPYPVYEWEAVEKPYTQSSLIIEDITEGQIINEESALNYPFYRKYRINLPIIYDIHIGDNQSAQIWEGTGQLYDDGSNGAVTSSNPYGTKKLSFTIPVNYPIKSNATCIELSGKMTMDCYEINKPASDYFELTASSLQNLIFFKNNTIEVGKNFLYTANDITKNGDEINFADDSEKGVITQIRRTPFGIKVELYTNLSTSSTTRSYMTHVRITNLYIRFYNGSVDLNKDIYENLTITPVEMYNNLIGG